MWSWRGAAVLALCALLARARPELVQEGRYVYMWMPEDERASVSRPLLCFSLSHSSLGPAPSSDSGSPTCARFGDLCGTKTSTGPGGLDLFPPGSRVEAWWQHTGETWPITKRGQIITATVAFSSLHQSHTGHVHGHLDLALDPEVDDGGADARRLHRVNLGDGVCLTLFFDMHGGIASRKRHRVSDESSCRRRAPSYVQCHRNDLSTSGTGASSTKNMSSALGCNPPTLCSTQPGSGVR